MGEVVDLLDRPVYWMSEVDQVLGLPKRTARRWIDGYTRDGKPYPPVVRVEHTGDDAVTWGELVETRLLATYRAAGVPWPKLRPAVERLRARLHTPYPLAHQAPFIKQWGRDLIWQAQDDAGLGRSDWLVERLSDGQLLLTGPAEEFINCLVYEAGIAVRMRPRETRHVVMDPLIRSGTPVVRAVPTDMLAELYRAGDTIDNLAHWYDLDVAVIEDALRYEGELELAAASNG